MGSTSLCECRWDLDRDRHLLEKGKAMTDAIWEVDPEALAEACEYLGLSYPVSVTPTDREYVGKYHGIGHYGPGTNGVPTEQPTHFIQIQSDITGVWASGVLWHELTHAMQAEREMPEGDYDERGVVRWKSGKRSMTNNYGYESRSLGGFSDGAHLPNSKYTDISYEREANGNTHHSSEVPILVDKDESRRVWRVDMQWSPAYGKPYEKAEVHYVIASSADVAKDFCKREYAGKEHWRWDYTVTPTDRPPIPATA